MGGKERAAIAFFVILGAAAFASPSIFFVQPEGEYTQENFAYLNVSVSGTVDTFKLNWNGTNAAVYSPELLGAWNLNGNGFDWSKYGNGGSLLDGNTSNADGTTPPAFVPGKFGQGLEFDGYDDYFNVSSWAGTGAELTIEAWVFKGSSKNQDIFTKKWDGDDYGYKLRILANDLLELQLRNETNASGYLRSNAALLNNTWYHVAGTYDGSEMRLYVNGDLDNSKSFAGGINPGTDIPVIGAYIGAREGAMAYVFNGTLDEVRAYSRAKSPVEIGLTYNSELGRYYLNKTGLSEGIYSYYAWANDSSGESQTGTRTLTVDWNPPSWLQAPQDQSVGYGRAFYYDLNASDNFGILQYSVNDTRFKISQMGVVENNTLLAVGTYDLKARVNDSAGNANSGNFRVAVQDNVPPSIAVQHPYGGQKFVSLGIPLNFTAWDLGGVGACKYELWNSSGAYNISLPGCMNSTMVGVTDGANTVKVWAGDASNNWNASTQISFEVDTTRPRVSIQNPQAVVYTSKTISLNFTAGDSSGISRCWYSLDGWASNVSLPNCQNTTILASEGANTLRLAANDTLGNLNDSAYVPFSVDSTAPAWVEIPADRTIEYGDTLYYKVNATDANGLGEYSVNDSANFKVNPATGEIENKTFLGIGSYSLRAGVNDTYGNLNSSAFTVTVQDTTLPIVLVQSPESRNYTSKAISLNYTAWDLGGISSCKYELAGVNTTIPGCQNTTINAGENASVLKLWANDSAGNWNYAAVGFLVDTTPPGFGLEQLNETAFNGSRTVKFTFDVLDFYDVSSCWAELALEDGSSTNITGSMGGNTCTAVGTVTSIGDFSFKPYANDTHGNVGNGTMQRGVRALLEWGPYQQDVTETTVAGGSAYITQILAANNTLGSIAANNIPTGVQARAGWSCTEQSTSLSVPAGAYMQLYANNCSNTSIITKNEGAWGSVIATESNQNISRSLSGTNNDPLLSYSNVFWSTANESSACWSSQQVSGTFSISAGGSWAAAANMSGDCISEGGWSNFEVYGTPTEQAQNITKSRTVSNLAGLIFYNVPWSTSNDSSACWNYQTPVSGTYDLADAVAQSVNMSGDCVNESLWTAAGVKGAPTVTSQTINATKTITSLDTDYTFTVGWSHDPDSNACWTSGTTSGTYSLAASTAIEANRTGDCIQEENADHWRQDTTHTTIVNGTAYVTSNYTIKNIAAYNFTGLDLTQNITNRTGWSCPEKIGSLELAANAGLYHPQAINCTKENVVTKTLAHKRAYNSSVLVGEPLYALYNFTVENSDTLPYSNVLANYSGDINHSEWGNTSTEIEYLNIIGSAALHRIVNVSKITVQEEWGGCSITQYGEYRKHDCSSNLTVLESELTLNLTVAYVIPVSKLYRWEWRDGTLTTNLVDGSSAGVNRTEGAGGVNITVNTSHSGSYSLALGTHPFELVFYTYPPSPAYQPPTDNDGAMVNRNYTFVNVSSTQELSSCYLEWNVAGNISAIADGRNCYLNRTGIPDGWYSYKVWVNNTVGNWKDVPMRTILIDTTPPIVDISYQGGWQNVLGLAKNGSDPESGVVECRLEYKNSTVTPESFGEWILASDDAAPCPVDSVLAGYMNSIAANNRSYQFRYSARNGADAWGYANITNVTKLDNTAPVISYLAYTDGWQNETLNITIGKYAYDPDSGISECVLQYKNLSVFNNILQGDFNLMGWENASSPDDCALQNFTGTNGMAYRFRYNVKNNAGNWSGWAEPSNIAKLDITPPEFVEVTYPEKWYNDTVRMPFTLWGNDSQSGILDCDLQYRNATMYNGAVKDGVWSQWASVGAEGGDCGTTDHDGVHGGAYQFRYRLKNHANLWSGFSGNANKSMVDTSPPAGAIYYLNGWQTSLPVGISTVEYDNESGMAEYYLDVRSNRTSDGSFGNFDLIPWSLLSGSPPPYSFSGTHGYAYQFRYRVKNNASRWNSFEVKYSPGYPDFVVAIDTTPPLLGLSYLNTWQTQLAIPIDISSADPESGILYCNLSYRNSTLVEGRTDFWSSWTETSGNDCMRTSFGAQDGQAYKFRLNVTNNAGSTNETIGTNTTYVDSTNPLGVGVFYPDGWRTSTSLSIGTSGRDPESGISGCDLEYNRTQLDRGGFTTWSGWAEYGGEWGDCPSFENAEGTQTLSLANGYAYRFRFRVRNKVDVTSAYYENTNITKIDATPPTLSFDYAQGWRNSLPFLFASKIQDDPESGIAYCNLSFKNITLAGGSPAPGWDGTLLWKQTDGTEGDDCTLGSFSTLNGGSIDGQGLRLKYNATNNAGLTNEYSPANEAWIDTSPPAITLSYPTGWNTSGNVGISIIKTDPQSGIDAASCTLFEKTAAVQSSNGVSEGIPQAWSGWNSLGTYCNSYSSARGTGAYQYNFSVRNNAGLYSSAAGGIYKIDTSTPQGFSFDFDNACAACWNGWKTDNNQVSLLRGGYDYDSGIDCDLQYKYANATPDESDNALNAYGSWQGSAWGDCSNIFYAPASGGYGFQYLIRNWAGSYANGGAYLDRSPKEIRLETSAPNVDFRYPSWANESATISFLAADERDPESGKELCRLDYRSASLVNKHGSPGAWSAWSTRYANDCSFTQFSGSNWMAYQFNYTVRNWAGLVTNTNRGDWTGIDTTPPDSSTDERMGISYSSKNLASQWQTADQYIGITWSGTDNQSGIGGCDVEFNRNRLVEGVPQGWEGWTSYGSEGGECGSGNVFTFDGSNGYAYRFRFKLRNGANLWTGFIEKANNVSIDYTSPDITEFSYPTGWRNTSAQLSMSVVHTEKDDQSGLLPNGCTIEYQNVSLSRGAYDFTGAPWASLASGNCGTMGNPPVTLANGRAFRLRETAKNNINPQTSLNTITVTTGSDIKTDITNATGVRIYYPAASSQNGWWNLSLSIPIVQAGDDMESGIAECDLEYQEANMSWGVSGDFSVWNEGGNCVNSFTAKNGHAYKFRYRAKNGASLWTDYTYNQDDNITRVDVTKPNTTATIRGETPNVGGGVLPSGWYNGSRELNLTANDPESGPDRCYSSPACFYSIDGQAYNVSTSPLGIVEGIHTYSFYSINNAGLKEDAQTITIKKDTTKPAINRVRADLESVETGWNTPIRVSANITDFAGISYANACKTPADCNGVPANRWCSMAQAGGVWSCDIPTNGLALGNYDYYVSASDINYWYTASEKRRFKVRETKLDINGSSGQPIDMQSTGTIIVNYAEYDGTNRMHIPKAACTLSGDFAGALVDTGAYYAKISKPFRTDQHTYQVSCSKEGYAAMSLAGSVEGKDLAVLAWFSNDPLNLDGDNYLYATATILGHWPQNPPNVKDTNARTASYTLSSKEGDFLNGSMTWDGTQWYARFLPDFGNYTAVVHFEDSAGIEGTGIVNAATYGALGISTDAPALISIDLGSSSVARVYVNNSGKKERYYNLTIAGDLSLVSLDGVRLSGSSATITQLVGNKTTKTHYVEVTGRMITRQPESLSVQATNLKSARDSASLNITYQVTNKPVYGVRVAPDLDIFSIAMLLLLGLAYVSRRKQQ